MSLQSEASRGSSTEGLVQHMSSTAAAATALSYSKPESGGAKPMLDFIMIVLISLLTLISIGVIKGSDKITSEGSEQK